MKTNPYRIAPEPTAFGVPLEQGERVIGVYDTDLRLAQGFLVVVVSSFFVTVGIVGFCRGDVRAGWTCTGCIVLLVAIAALAEMFVARRILVTDRRVLLLARKRTPRAMRLADVSDVKAVRFARAAYAQALGNDLQGAEGAPLADLARDVRKADLAEQAPKTSETYWEGANGIVLIGPSSKLRLRTLEASELGLLLARCALQPGFLETTPEVAFEP